MAIWLYFLLFFCEHFFRCLWSFVYTKTLRSLCASLWVFLAVLAWFLNNFVVCSYMLLCIQLRRSDALALAFSMIQFHLSIYCFVCWGKLNDFHLFWIWLSNVLLLLFLSLSLAVLRINWVWNASVQSCPIERKNSIFLCFATHCTMLFSDLRGK